MSRLRNIALFAQFPRFSRIRPTVPFDPETDTLLLDEDGGRLPLAVAVARYPELESDLTDLQSIVVGPFADCDARAAIEQNRDRRQHVLLIIGGLLAASFGALQAVLDNQVWPGIVVAAVAAGTTAVASVGRQSAALDGYLSNRLRAERLRSTYFDYLARGLVQFGSDDRRRQLQEHVLGLRYDELKVGR